MGGSEVQTEALFTLSIGGFIVPFGLHLTQPYTSSHPLIAENLKLTKPCCLSNEVPVAFTFLNRLYSERLSPRTRW